MIKSIGHPVLGGPCSLCNRRMPWHDRQGQSAVEVALLLPALMVLLMGIILTGFSLYAFIQVTNAAREGARAGSLYRITQADSGWDLPTTVRNAICNASANPKTSALGYLVNLASASACSDASSFSVNNDVACTLNGVACPNGSNLQQGDDLNVTVTYHYSIPIWSGRLPMFPKVIVIVRNVRMEVQ